MREIIVLGLLASLVGCGGAPARGPEMAAAERPSGRTPEGGGLPQNAAPSRDPFALPPRPAAKDLLTIEGGGEPIDVAAAQKTMRTNGVAPRAKTCAAYAPPKEVAAAVAKSDPLTRDALLADLAPVACADAITDKKIPASGSLEGKHASVLLGLSLASKLARTALTPPKLDGAAASKAKVKAFIKGPLAKWVVEQASAIEALSAAAVGLRGYGRGLAAIEAGIADLRLVDKIRSAPTPKGWDPELVAVYEAALDEALEPRKRRGRDAALVGLADLAQVGVLRDESVTSARSLLAKLYGGRRIDALDGLLLPEWKEPTGVVPAYWAAASDVDLPAEGVPLRPKCSGATCLDYARGRFEMARTYWRRADFAEAAHAAKESASDPHARLLLALSVTLAKGPDGAKEMMAAPAPSALGLDRVEALDALVAEGGPLAGMAAYDAAHLRALSVPEGAAAAPYLRDVATRFEKSAALLEDPAHEKLAKQRAADAKEAAARVDHR